mmetsp:Transcript_31215/g.90136  ORF Transcript_31215/g.90136 Transcript_31215/m.90136 type:complete len:247 (+) Transcript_31215:927-1667(+)
MVRKAEPSTSLGSPWRTDSDNLAAAQAWEASGSRAKIVRQATVNPDGATSPSKLSWASNSAAPEMPRTATSAATTACTTSRICDLDWRSTVSAFSCAALAATASARAWRTSSPSMAPTASFNRLASANTSNTAVCAPLAAFSARSAAFAASSSTKLASPAPKISRPSAQGPSAAANFGNQTSAFSTTTLALSSKVSPLDCCCLCFRTSCRSANPSIVAKHLSNNSALRSSSASVRPPPGKLSSLAR